MEKHVGKRGKYMAKVTKELERLLARAAKKLDAAQDARSDVDDYLEEHYGINTKEEYKTRVPGVLVLTAIMSEN